MGSMISIHFSDTPVTNFDTATRAASGDAFKKFFHAMLREGIYIAPSAYETWFICDALSREDLDATIEACRKASKELV
jgi:glutamate-1-semialdehyde 2,1-aminomutase